jgi:hypothetical protein
VHKIQSNHNPKFCPFPDPLKLSHIYRFLTIATTLLSTPFIVEYRAYLLGMYTGIKERWVQRKWQARREAEI